LPASQLDGDGVFRWRFNPLAIRRQWRASHRGILLDVLPHFDYA
jgi:hypothetical protein